MSSKPPKPGRHHHEAPHESQSRSRPPRRARSSSPALHPVPKQPPIYLGAIPRYVPPSTSQAPVVPSAFSFALRRRGDPHRLPSAHRSPGPAKLKRRRRPRRPRPRPRSRSGGSDREESLPPPPPPPVPTSSNYPAASNADSVAYFLARVEADRAREEAARKREREERRRERERGRERRRRDRENARDGGWVEGDAYGDYADGGIPRHDEEAAARYPPRASSAPPASQVHIHGTERGQDDERRADSRRRHRRHHSHHRRHRHKHHRRAGEQRHRRQKKRSRTGMRNFFASLRRKLGELLRPAGEGAGAGKVQAQFDGYMTPVRTQYQRDGSGVGSSRVSYQRRGRRLGERGQAPFFMRGGRSPGQSELPGLGSRRRFNAFMESAVGLGPPSSATPPPLPPRRMRGGIPPGGFPGVEQVTAEREPPRSRGSRGSRSSRSTISIFAHRFVGPFLSEADEPPTPDSDSGQRKVNWRTRKLLTTGSPTTPRSSRDSSPGRRGRSGDQEPTVPPVPESITPHRVSSGSSMGIGALYESFSAHSRHSSSGSSMGLRGLYESLPGHSRHSSSGSSMGIRALYSSSPVHSVLSSSPRRDSSPGYGLAGLFATPPMVSSSARQSPVSRPSSDYGLQRLFASPYASSASSFGLRWVFGD
ncbi:hypothetical protein F4861DRAFT_329396 [Xylaria intraflava]|nr:hypothetical protein F4861DRAFT_329396 [Xylaria intraflava]